MKEALIDVEKVTIAIDEVMEMFAALEMNVAECIHVVRTLDYTFKARYGDAYDAVRDAIELQDALDLADSGNL